MAEPAEQQRRTLRDILGDVSENDRYAEFFGSFKPGTEEAMRELSEKIEASFAKIDEWENGAAQWQGSADRYSELAAESQQRADALANRAKRLRDYMVFELRVNGFEKIPGVTISAALKRANTPKTIIGKAADALDMKKYPALVEQIPRSYRWDTKAVCAALKEIAAKVDRGEQLSEAETALNGIARIEYSYSLKFQPKAVKE